MEFSVDGGVSRCTRMHHLNSTKSTLAYEDSSPTFNKSVYCNESRYFVGKAGKPFSIHVRHLAVIADAYFLKIMCIQNSQ